MLALIIVLPFAIAIFCSLFMMAHGISPLGTALTVDNKRNYAVVYAIIVLPFITIPLCFTDMLSHVGRPGQVAFILGSILLSILSAECSYFLAKKKKWHKVLAGASAVMGTIYIELVILTVLFGG